MACGRIDAKIACHLDAPVETLASLGIASAFSNASANILPIIPMEWSPSAKIPASGPIPNARTKIAAKMRSGIARVKVMIPRQRANTNAFGVVFFAAPKDNGKLINTAMVVPSSAIHSVSIVADTMLFNK